MRKPGTKSCGLSLHVLNELYLMLHLFKTVIYLIRLNMELGMTSHSADHVIVLDRKDGLSVLVGALKQHEYLSKGRCWTIL